METKDVTCHWHVYDFSTWYWPSIFHRLVSGMWRPLCASWGISPSIFPVCILVCNVPQYYNIKWFASEWIHQKFTSPFLKLYIPSLAVQCIPKQNTWHTITIRRELVYVLYAQWTSSFIDYLVCIISRGQWQIKIVGMLISSVTLVTFSCITPKSMTKLFITRPPGVASMTTIVSFVVYVSSNYPV